MPSLEQLVVTARTETTAVAFVVSCPPTDEDHRRLSDLLAAMPGLADAEWTTTPGSDSR